MDTPALTVYGTAWCPDCRRAKKFLGENRIPFNWIDIEQDHAAEEIVLQKNNGKRIIPTIVFADGSVLMEPSNAELAQKLQLATTAQQAFYDLIVIGGGPGGLTAALYAAREGLDVLVIERSGLGGQAGITVGIDNFPGFPEGISGQAFAERLVQQARRFNVEILQAVDVVGLSFADGYRMVHTANGERYGAEAVLVASGATYRRLAVPGEDEYIGAGIHFCATCDGPFYKGAAEIVVVGGGNSACEEGLHLTKYADKVILLVRGDAPTASQVIVDKIKEPNSKVEIRTGVVIERIAGEDGKLTTIHVRNLKSGATEALHPAAVFVFIGQEPNSAWTGTFLAKDKYGFLYAGHTLIHSGTLHGREPFPFETSQPGFFAAGDVRHGSVKQIASAVGEGAAAAIAIREYLKCSLCQHETAALV